MVDMEQPWLMDLSSGSRMLLFTVPEKLLCVVPIKLLFTVPWKLLLSAPIKLLFSAPRKLLFPVSWKLLLSAPIKLLFTVSWKLLLSAPLSCCSLSLEAAVHCPQGAVVHPLPSPA